VIKLLATMGDLGHPSLPAIFEEASRLPPPMSVPERRAAFIFLGERETNHALLD
jgi:hypothetical protein